MSSAAKYNALTADRLRGLLSYDAATGIFTWLVSRGTAKKGSVAGFAWTGGYQKIRVDRRNHFAHRLAFLYMTGAWPNEEIDHINRARSDNRWENLRASTRAENMQNKSAYLVRKTSKFSGVSWAKRNSKWKAQIQVGGEKVGLGYFQTEDEAYAAYMAAKRNLHPRAYEVSTWQ